MKLSLTLLTLSGVCYSIAFFYHLLSFWGVREDGYRPASAFMRIGFLIGTFYFAAEAIEHGFFLPVANFSQAAAFFAWSLAFVYLVLLVRIQSESFGLILTPILLFLMGSAAWSAARTGGPAESVLPTLLNPYFTVHIASAFFAYASFAISFAAAVLYLMQHHELKAKHAGKFYHKLPSLEELERLIYQPILWGAPLLLAAVAIGVVWSKSAYGHYWLQDPKTLATAATAFVYLAILYLHYVSAQRGKQPVVLSVIAFMLVLFSFVGMRFVQGSHNFLQ